MADVEPACDSTDMSYTTLGREGIASRLYCNDRVHAPLPGPDAVDDAAIAFFHKNGFLAVNNVLTPAEVAAAFAGITHLVGQNDSQCVEFEKSFDKSITDPDQREAGVRKLMNFVNHDARLKAASTNATLLSIGRRLIGSELTMFQDMALLKPPSIGVEKPWHQDTAYFQIEPLDLILGTWTALDPALPENGCMHVIPGSHLEGPKPHYHDRDCQLPDEEIDVARDVVCPLAPGGTLFFSGLLHHGTPPNRSKLRRRALQFHFHSVNCRQVTPERITEHFHDNNGYAGCRGAWAGDLKVQPMPVRE